MGGVRQQAENWSRALRCHPSVAHSLIVYYQLFKLASNLRVSIKQTDSLPSLFFSRKHSEWVSYSTTCPDAWARQWITGDLLERCRVQCLDGLVSACSAVSSSLAATRKLPCITLKKSGHFTPERPPSTVAGRSNTALQAQDFYTSSLQQCQPIRPTCVFVRGPSRLESTSWKSAKINTSNHLKTLSKGTLLQQVTTIHFSFNVLYRCTS